MRTLIDSWKKKANRYQELKKQKGVTLLEIIIVLGIIGIIAAGVVVLAQRAFTTQDLTDASDHTNTIRVAMTEGFRDEASYPDAVSLVGVVKSELTSATSKTGPLPTLIKMGKLSASEVYNGFSNDPFEVGPAKLSNGAAKNKGFYVVVNGLETEECRNFISQVGSSWDYVEIKKAAAGALAIASGALEMDVPPSNTVLKSVQGEKLSSADITADTTCNNAGPNNAVVLGSR
ncbi:type IV pilus major pilin [Enterobacter kobei]|jgi:toxin co-regulated pilin|uniref:type IV pilus major pilin n=1 Tax=Enterobacter kobei TaxID=208224 RepID=UPI003A96D43D